MPGDAWVLIRQPRLTDAGPALPQPAQRHLPQAACPSRPLPVQKCPMRTSSRHVSLSWSSLGVVEVNKELQAAPGLAYWSWPCLLFQSGAGPKVRSRPHAAFRQSAGSAPGSEFLV